MENLPKENCPCKRLKCEFHGDCEGCRKHHVDSKHLPTCERLAIKAGKAKKKKTE